VRATVPKPGTLVLSTIVIAIALLAPLFIAYAADQMRTYTVLEKKYSLADNIESVILRYYNGSEYKYATLDYVVNGDNVIVPDITQPSDYQSTNGFHVLINETLLTPTMLWEAGVVELHIYVESSSTMDEITVQIWVSDAGKYLLTLKAKPNATSCEIKHEYSTTDLARYASYTGPWQFEFYTFNSPDGIP